MTGTGWEFYSVNFSIIATLIVSVAMFLGMMIGRNESDRLAHVDTMAGDEGED